MVRKRVVIAMSGGVDSSVAAMLLKNKGFEVIGLTMCFGLGRDNDSRRPGCCGFEASRDAKRVADLLNIKHYNLNFADVLNKKVIKKFIDEYLKGRTPNPCVDCNREIKFRVLFNKAKELGADFLATGHYARVYQDKKTKKFFIKKAKDPLKDQSYFLYDIDKDILPQILFPLGEMTKQEVRALACKFRLPIADKPASQEICFLNGTDYRLFLKDRFRKNVYKEGLIKDIKGNILGKHKGIPFYTIGQRTGLGIAYKEALYVIRIDSKHNLIIVGSKEHAFSKKLIVKNVYMEIDFPQRQKLELMTKIRYNHTPSLATVEPISKFTFKINFKIPQFAVTPGQAAVFYKKDLLVGGGTIEESL
jgi:tRNA-specific 2-thiouridylase